MKKLTRQEMIDKIESVTGTLSSFPYNLISTEDLLKLLAVCAIANVAMAEEKQREKEE